MIVQTSPFTYKNNTHPNGWVLFFWRSRRDLNPRYPFGVHTISSRARYDHFDTAPWVRHSCRLAYDTTTVSVCQVLILHFSLVFILVAVFGMSVEIRYTKVLPPSRPAASDCPPDSRIEWFESLHQKRKIPEQHMLFWYFWSECRDSNSRPLEPHSSAIPNFATPGSCRSSD